MKLKIAFLLIVLLTITIFESAIANAGTMMDMVELKFPLINAEPFNIIDINLAAPPTAQLAFNNAKDAATFNYLYTAIISANATADFLYYSNVDGEFNTRENNEEYGLFATGDYPLKLLIDSSSNNSIDSQFQFDA